MSPVWGALLLIYFVVLGGLALFGTHRLYLSALFLTRRRRPALAPGAVPSVTVQLPVFNEIHVLERLVAAACALRHPRSLLQIQILDDSTDATTRLAAALAAEWSERGFDITCIHRDRRDGFKAGALAHAMASARGEFLAIFDADFVPPADFLERALAPFGDPRVGMVQARWGHLNRGHSALTRAQALILDAHFRVEQGARAASGRFFGFNGTAGIFRRRCIEEAGGWQTDTLTEDLDLSYRAQVAGWEFRFMDDLICPAELPVEMDALRTQQHRWAKGSLQTALKLAPALLRAPLRPRIRLEAALHLTNNLAYLLLCAASILVVPALAARKALGWSAAPVDLALFIAGTCSFALYAAVSQRGTGRGAARSLADILLAMALGAGLALNNALAVLEALRRIPGAFERTPKYGADDRTPDRTRRRVGRLYRGEPTSLPPIELLLAILLTASTAWALSEGLYASIPFIVLFATGYAYVSLTSLIQQHRRRSASAPEVPSPTVVAFEGRGALPLRRPLRTSSEHRP